MYTDMDGCWLQGRAISPEDLAWIARYVLDHPGHPRKRIAQALCEHWEWRNGRGHWKEMAARSLLNKLADRGLVKLPPLRLWIRRQAATGRGAAEKPPAGSAITGALRDLLPVRVQLVQEGSTTWQAWAAYLRHYHYLGLHIVGENLGYLACDGQDRALAALLFGAAAWRCAARDRYLAWDDRQRAESLARVVNNTRFLVLPWVRVPHLASHVLGQVQRRIDADWTAKYGHGVDWLETFVDRARFQGTCYRAANWKVVGQTQGRGRQDRAHRGGVGCKAVLLYAVAARARRPVR